MRAESGRLTRGWFVGSGLVALAAPALAADPALTPVRVGLTPQGGVVPTLWGVQSGLFAKNGLDVSLQRLNSGAAIAAAVIGGAVDIGYSSIFGLIQAHLKGVQFKLVSVSAVYDSADQNNAFVVAKDNPITNPRELDGQTIGTPALDDLFSIVTSAWIDQNGGHSKTVHFVELPTPLAGPAIKAGRITGAMMVDPFLQEVISPSGGGRILGYPFNVIAPKFAISYYFCLASYALQNPDVISRFQRVIAAASDYAITHSSQVVPLVVKYTNLSPEDVARTPLGIGSGLNPKMLQPVIDFAARTKFIEHGFPATEISAPWEARPSGH
jgi:NitT/TauT family transport system substrate-binding protein